MFKIVQNCSRLFKIVQKSSKLSEIFQNRSKLFKIVQNCPNWSKMINWYIFFSYLGQDGLHGSAPVSPTCHLWHPTRMPMVLHKLEFVTSQDKCLLEPITILHVLKELPPEVADLDQNKNPWNFKSSKAELPKVGIFFELNFLPWECLLIK